MSKSAKVVLGRLSQGSLSRYRQERRTGFALLALANLFLARRTLASA